LRVRLVRREIDFPRHGRIRALRAADLEASIGRRNEHANHGRRDTAMYVDPASQVDEGFSAKYANHLPSGERSHRCG
jgi:hypothetical protein